MSNLDEQLIEYIKEVKDLWHPEELVLPRVYVIQDYHDLLVALRLKISRVDAIMGNVILIINQAKLKARHARIEHDDAWENAVRTTSTVEYSSAKEREAQYALKTFALRKSLRDAENFLDNSLWTKDYIYTVQQSLASFRRDLELASRLATDEIRLSH